MVVMTPAEAATAAADYIHEHGWMKGALRNHSDGRVCIAGSILAVLGLLDGDPARDIDTPDPRYRVYDSIITAIEGKTGNAAVTWNDHYASSQEEVEVLLRSLVFTELVGSR